MRCPIILVLKHAIVLFRRQIIFFKRKISICQFKENDVCSCSRHSDLYDSRSAQVSWQRWPSFGQSAQEEVRSRPPHCPCVNAITTGKPSSSLSPRRVLLFLDRLVLCSHPAGLGPGCYNGSGGWSQNSAYPPASTCLWEEGDKPWFSPSQHPCSKTGARLDVEKKVTWPSSFSTELLQVS